MLATQEMLVELMKEKYKEPYVKGLAPRELSSKSTHWIQGPIIYAPKSQTHTLVVITKSHIPLNPSLSAPGIIREFHIELQKITEGFIKKMNVSLLLHMAPIPILRLNTFNPVSNLFSIILNYIIT